MNSYADMYLNFKDNQEWLSKKFENMTYEDFENFVGYCLKQLGFASDESNGAEFFRVKGLLLALARKEHEISCFMDGIDDERRAGSLKCATSYYELAKGFYPKEEQSQVEAAWEYSKEYGRRFGYPSVVAELLAPHRLFRED